MARTSRSRSAARSAPISTAPATRYLDKRQAAAYLHVGQKRFHKLIRDGNLAVIRFGPSTPRFTPEDLDACAARMREVRSAKRGRRV